MRMISLIKNQLRASRLSKVQKTERGMAALVVTVILISLLSAMAVAFSLIMSRESQKALNNQLSQSAYNAAASGINDAISYLHDNPNTNVTQCKDLLSTGKPLSLAADLSGNGSTKYTCVLINNTPHNIIYQNIPAGGSQVVKTSYSAPVSKLMFSWKSNNPGYNNFVPALESGQLKDETTWKAGKYTPMLKVSLYPVFADTQDASFATANAKTYYLYPLQASGFSVNTLSYATTSGTLKPVECGLKNNNGQFNGTGAYDCTLILNNLPTANPAGYIYYIRITPIYGAADVEIRANDTTPASSEVNFVSTQAVIDVTAQSSSVLKRLQARVDISSLNGTSQDIDARDNNIPEFALRSANTTCKRLQNQGSALFPVFIEKSTIGYCGVDLSVIPPLDPPIIDPFSCHSTGQKSGSCTGTIDPNNGQITYCHFSSTAGDGPDCALTAKPSAPSYTTTPYDVSWGLGSLSPSTYYEVTLCADNPASPPSHTCKTASFTTDSPPLPPPSVGKQGVLVQWSGGSWTADIIDNGNGAGLAQCEFYTSKGGSWIQTVNIKDNPPGNNNQMHASGSVPGGANYEICYAVDGGSGEYPSVVPPASPVTVNWDAVLWYHFPTVTTGICHDGVHSYIICISWTATQAGNGSGSFTCTTNWGAVRNTYFGLWVTEGWPDGKDPRPQTVWVTCTGLGGATGETTHVECKNSPDLRNGNDCRFKPAP